jgi:hypothetical protein
MGTVKIPPTTEGEIQRAIEAGRQRRASEHRAASVRYDAERDAIEIELTDGAGRHCRYSRDGRKGRCHKDLQPSGRLQERMGYRRERHAAA